jgi:hypothetical protein
LESVYFHECYLRPSRAEDCAALAPRLRAADVTELRLAGQGEPADALRASFDNSKKCVSVATQDDVVQMMFGVAWTRTPRVGLVWMLSSDWIFQAKHTFLRHSRPIVGWMLEDHDLILNDIHDENVTSMNWLEWLGFTAISHTPDFGIGAPFTEMALFKDDQTRAMYLERVWPMPQTIAEFMNA